MIIYNQSGVEVIEILVDDKSYRYKEIMGENTLTLYFSLPTFIEIPEGAYIDFKNERYFLLNPENFTQNHTQSYNYTLLLDSYQSMLKLIKFKFFTMADGVVNSAFEIKFSLTFTPVQFAQLLADNMNVSDPTGGWSVGSCITSDPVCIDFNNDYCFDVLAKLTDAFTTEWEFDNKMINIQPVEKLKDTPLPLKYGYNCGLIPGTTRANVSTSKAITRLFIEGSDQNIDSSTYGCTTLCMPKNQTINYNGIDYKTDATGSYIERVTPMGRMVEDSLDVTKIYPSRVGTVSQVNTVNADTNLYDIIDASIPDDLDFSQDVIAGETMSIIFQTGQLAGKEFEVTYKPTDKRFEIVPSTDNGISYPSGSILPEVGDKYAVFHISLPEDYISEAETTVLNQAVAYLFDNEQPKYTYTGVLDIIYAKRNWLAIGGFLNCGYFILLSDDQYLDYPISIRITAVKEFLNWPEQPEITLSNEITSETLSTVLNKIPTQIQATDRKDQVVTRNARRQWADMKQTTEMLQSSLLNFSTSISPVSVSTMQLIAGDESLQFDFVASSTTTDPIPHAETYDPATKQFRSASGIIQHKTLGITTISSSHAASEYKWWQMSTYLSPVLDEPDKAYYLYAKVSKTDETGIFLLSETVIGIEDVDGYYHLLMGILNSENEGDRSYSQLYGYSELTPGRLITKKIVSPDGKTYFDLENNVIAGNIKFLSGDTYTDIEKGISDAQQAAIDAASNDATSKANAAAELAYENSQAYVTAIQSDLQGQIDGEIISWFMSVDPLNSNSPASDWTTDILRNQHANDTYTNILTGGCWRWQNFGMPTNPVWEWGVISDTATQVALRNAAIAQTTANGKRTTFAVQPTTPYLVGDLWLNNGDLFSCNVARSIGAFVSGDWSKGVKYTDDTAANAAQTAANLAIANAETAQIAANSAQTTANTSATNASNALGQLTNITSDNVLSSAEKSGERSNWNIISSEKSINDTQADAFSVSKVAYDNAFQALATYLNNGTAWSSGIPSWLADANLGTNTTIVGTTYRTNWQAYYDARTALLNSISLQAKTLANAAQTAANTAITNAANAQTSANSAASAASAAQTAANTAQTAANAASTTALTAQTAANTAETNATNALGQLTNITSDNVLSSAEKSGERSNWNIISSEKSVNDTQADDFSVSRIAYDNAFNALATYLNAGTAWSSGIPSWLADANLGTNTTIVGSTYRTNWQAYYDARTSLLNAISLQAKTLANAAQTAANAAQTTANAANTSASAAVASAGGAMSAVQALAYLSTAMTGSTDINGGLVATNVILLKTIAGIITGGFSGLASDNIGTWTGGTYQDALNSIAKIILRKDGSGQLAGGNILWDASGNLSITGILNALSGGQIGGLKVIGQALMSDSMEFGESSLETLDLLKTPITVTVPRIPSWSNSANDYVEAETQILTLSASAKIIMLASTGSSQQYAGQENFTQSRFWVTDANGITVYEEILQSDTYGDTLHRFEQTLLKGTYIIHVSNSVLTNNNYNPLKVNLYGEQNYDSITYTGLPFKTKIGNNGFYSFWSNLCYLYFSSINGLTVKGTTDLPGVLATGTVSSTGGQSNVWGAKKALASATKGGTGIYTVPHTIGNVNYTVQVTSEPYFNGSRYFPCIASVRNKTNTSFDVYIIGDDATQRDANFDYTITGAN